MRRQPRPLGARLGVDGSPEGGRPGRGGRGLLARRPRRGRRGRRTPAGRLAEGRGQLHPGAPLGAVDRPDRRPRDRGQLLGVGALAAEPARARVLPLRRLPERQDHPARPPLGHRVARRPLEHERAVGRDRARGLHVRAARVHRRAVPRVGAPRRVDRAPLADADRPQAPDRPRPGAGRAGRPRRLEPPHGSRPALEVELLPPPRPPLCRRDPAEREAAPAGRAAAGNRLLPRQGVPGHRARRVHRRRPRRPRRPAGARSRTR